MSVAICAAVYLRSDGGFLRSSAPKKSQLPPAT